MEYAVSNQCFPTSKPVQVIWCHPLQRHQMNLSQYWAWIVTFVGSCLHPSKEVAGSMQMQYDARNIQTVHVAYHTIEKTIIH